MEVSRGGTFRLQAALLEVDELEELFPIQDEGDWSPVHRHWLDRDDSHVCHYKRSLGSPIG